MILATALALLAAALHATWNLLLKTAPDAERDLTSWGLYLVGGVLVIPVVVGLGGPGLASVPWRLRSAGRCCSATSCPGRPGWPSPWWRVR